MLFEFIVIFNMVGRCSLIRLLSSPITFQVSDHAGLSQIDGVEITLQKVVN